MIKEVSPKLNTVQWVEAMLKIVVKVFDGWLQCATESKDLDAMMKAKQVVYHRFSFGRVHEQRVSFVVPFCARRFSSCPVYRSVSHTRFRVESIQVIKGLSVSELPDYSSQFV